jgi:hypothetical protein
MQSADLVPVLGHPRVLSEGLSDAQRRAVAYEGDDLAGVGVYEPLFGPHAEGVIAVREDDSHALVPYLLDELLGRVEHAGLVAVRFVFASREQLHLAERLSTVRAHCELRRDWLDIRLEPALSAAAPGAAT